LRGEAENESDDDGYQARLIVLQAGAIGNFDRSLEDLMAGYQALLDEIRLRQPLAKILLCAPLPRGGRIQGWRLWAPEHEAVFAALVDDETVFYTAIGDRFFNPDGSFKAET
jgi:hypothetical protein